MASAPAESRRFVAAPADFPTKILLGSTLAILGVLVVGGAVQVGISSGEGDALGIVRGLGYALLALLVGAFTLARAPRAYRLERDGVHGTVLVVERRWSAAVRLALSRYVEVHDAKRVIFPWVPLLSGTRVFGLRGGTRRGVARGVLVVRPRRPSRVDLQRTGPSPHIGVPR